MKQKNYCNKNDNELSWIFVLLVFIVIYIVIHSFITHG